MDAQALTLSAVTRQEAARAFARVADPEGLATPESMAAAGECYRINGPTGHVVFCLDFSGPQSWIVAAAGQGQGMTECLWVAEEMARGVGCKALGFQTGRRGLVRRARKLGYRITGQVGAGVKLEKTL